LLEIPELFGERDVVSVGIDQAPYPLIETYEVRLANLPHPVDAGKIIHQPPLPQDFHKEGLHTGDLFFPYDPIGFRLYRVL